MVIIVLGLLIIISLTVISLIVSIIFVPELKIKKLRLETFWIVTLFGALFLFAFKYLSLAEALTGFTSKSSINPLKILTIFISMTILSIVLDELGFFQRLAYLALMKAKGKQIIVFIYLYSIISLLTIFTSNDIIILTFTPFICYFTKRAKINPIPYLISEFVAANTWSMMLMIGNPTNIYLGSAYEIGFLNYLKIMCLPTVGSALVAFIILIMLFRKQLQNDIDVSEITEVKLQDKPMVRIALIHLILCTALLTVSAYLRFEMYLICLLFCLSDLLIVYLYQRFIDKKKPVIFIRTILRAPWTLIPFLLSMFVFVLTLNKYEITKTIASYLNNFHPIYAYGLTSFLSANIINNIPMTVLYSDIIVNIPVSNYYFQTSAIYATIIGSNIGAYLTPIGALAGIMWIRLLKKENIKLSFWKFIKYGITLGIPTILSALGILSLVI